MKAGENGAAMTARRERFDPMNESRAGLLTVFLKARKKLSVLFLCSALGANMLAWNDSAGSSVVLISSISSDW